MGSPSPRDIACGILLRVSRGRDHASTLLRGIDDAAIAARDRALITELVNGVLRRRLYLDHVIEAYASRPLARIDAELIEVLRLALYQLLFLQRVPAHAAVNEAVRMARARCRDRGRAAASFVNGLLRSVLRDKQQAAALPRGQAGEAPERRLSLSESYPVWIVKRWIERFGGEETGRLLAAGNRPAPTALRVNLRWTTVPDLAHRLAGEHVRVRPSRLLDDFLVVEHGAAQRTRCFAEGLFYIQDEASGLVARMVAGVGSPAGRVLDACAAPGGKALALADAAGVSGQVVAVDRSLPRLRMLMRNVSRMKMPACVAVAADMAGPHTPLAAGVMFDAVLVDAPCTGTGVIRRHPELRYRLTLSDLDRQVETQARLLERCAGLVKPGGTMVYAVCSLEPEEGIEQVRRFLARHDGFEVADPTPYLPPPARGLVTRRESWPFLETLPHRDDLDGFFAARMERHQ